MAHSFKPQHFIKQQLTFFVLFLWLLKNQIQTFTVSIDHLLKKKEFSRVIA